MNRVVDRAGRGWFGLTLDATDADIDTVVTMAREDPERIFRMEALIALHLVSAAGNREQRRLADDVIAELAVAADDHISEHARWLGAHPYDASWLPH